MLSVTLPLLVLILTGAAPAEPRVSRPTSSLGESVEPFELQDCRGAKIDSTQFKGKPIVLIFLGTECPLAKLYVARVEELRSRFEPQGVVFLAVDSNCQDSLAEMLQFARSHQLGCPFGKDVQQVLADQLNAVRTPEAHLLDAEHRVRYAGRIDDQYGIGYQRPQPTRQDLAEAIEDVLADRQVRIPMTESVGCHIGRAMAPRPSLGITWSEHIAAIVQNHCQDCHRPGQVAPFSLTSYQDTVGWWPTIAEVVQEERMPPWYADPNHGRFANDARLTHEEKQLILDWVKSGAPEGDPAHAPPPRHFDDGWQIEHPDQVVYISPEPFPIPADGILEYQWFEVDPGFTEDKWIKAVECRPGNPAVVHHVTVYFSPPGGSPLRLRDRINLVGGFAPGKRTLHVPWDGTAKFVPKGSTFRFEMHYTTNGTPQTDRSSIALLFADPAEVRKQLSVVLVADETFAIPPHVDNYKVESAYELDEDSHLRVMSPHMHLRGKSFLFEALYPDGSKETLLHVPRFDFNWQLDYLLAEPKPLPKGTTIHCVATFDNSAGNPSNPDPQAEVRWGEQTWEEMMIGAITITPAHQDLVAHIGPGIKYPETLLWGWSRRKLLAAASGTSIFAVLLAAGLAWRWRSRSLAGAFP